MKIAMESMLLLLPILIGISAVCSASETVFFGLSADERWRLQRERPGAGRVVEKLLEKPRGLLVTLLLANMSVNSLYFAIATVSLATTELSVVERLAIGIGEVLALIVFGEVLPKLVANSMRFPFAPILAWPALVLFRIITPIRVVLEHLVFIPLHRLTAPSIPKSGPSAEELREFVAAARVQGDITAEEEGMLGRLLILRRARVRDVMTHRTEMAALPRRCTRADVVRLAMASRLKRLPVVDGSHDRVIGILDVRKFLLDPRGVETPIDSYIQTPVIVPEIAMLEQLFELFRVQKTSLAIAVDEFGGTAGVVALEDAIEEIVGDIVAQDEVTPIAPQAIDDRTWRVDGKMSARAFCAHFGEASLLTHASTVGGIALEIKGDLPTVGQTFTFGSLDIRVDEVERGRARSLIVTRKSESNTNDDEDNSR